MNVVDIMLQDVVCLASLREAASLMLERRAACRRLRGCKRTWNGRCRA